MIEFGQRDAADSGESREMIVEFQATVDDFADIVRRSQRRANPGGPSHVGILIAILIGVLMGFALLAVLPLSLGGKLEGAGVVLLAYGSLYLFLSDRGPLYKRTIRQLYGARFGDLWPVRVRVELEDSGITFTQNGIRDTTDWSAIEGIDATSDAIYFLTADESVMAVRKRGFKTDTDLAEFLELAGRYLMPHRKRLPDQLHVCEGPEPPT